MNKSRYLHLKVCKEATTGDNFSDPVAACFVVCMMYYSMSRSGNFTSSGIGAIVSWCLLTFIYPYARFVYEFIAGFIFGDTVIITNIKVMLVWKIVIAALLFCLSMFIAPVGLVILFFYNKKQYQKALAETENNQPQ